MFKDVYLSIFILSSCTFFLGFAVAAWLFQRAKKREEEEYIRECERDFYREDKHSVFNDPPF